MPRPIFVIEFDLLTKNEKNQRGHWGAKASRASKGRTKAANYLKNRINPTQPPPFVLLTRIAPRALDDGDNLSSALSAVRDGVADAFGIDDRSKRIQYRYAQRKGALKYNAVEIAFFMEEPGA